jgi:hypothetical protein
MKNAVLRAALASTAIACAAPAAWADVYKSIGLGFEGVVVDDGQGNFLSVDLLDFYRGPLGGGSAAGTRFTQDLGVSFEPGTLSGVSQDVGGLGNYGTGAMPGPVGALVTLDASPLIRGSLVQGFGVGVSFWYSAYDRVTVRLFDVNGKPIGDETLLDATAGNNDCTGPDDLLYCKWAVASIGLQGVNVRSFEIQGLVAVDNLTFGSLTPFDGVVPIPEPSTYALMALGLLGVGAAARRRKAQAQRG